MIYGKHDDKTIKQFEEVIGKIWDNPELLGGLDNA